MDSRRAGAPIWTVVPPTSVSEGSPASGALVVGEADRRSASVAVVGGSRVTAPPSPAPGIAVDGEEPNVVVDPGSIGLGARNGHRSEFHDNVVQSASPEDDGAIAASAVVEWNLPRVSVVIPTFNEERNLPHVLARIPEAVHEVIVVDGHSVDDTVEVARLLRPDVRILHQNRTGKGNAMACGFAAATGDVIVMLDADGSADPQEIPRFVAALLGGADFAKGTRFAEGGGSGDITAVRAWGNRWLNRVTNVLFGTRYTDLCYGYNAFWARCLDHLELDPRHDEVGGKMWGDGFEIETIINTRMAKAGMRITEVPSFEHPRVHGESNLNTWRDGTRVLGALIAERFNGRARKKASVGAGGGGGAAPSGVARGLGDLASS